MSEIKQVWGIIKGYKCADLKMVQDPALAVFQHQQAIIDDLKTQLNNMEACYIGKKKECELLESNINNLTKQFSDCYEVAYAEYKKNADSYYSGKCDAFDLAEQLAGLALRGES